MIRYRLIAILIGAMAFCYGQLVLAVSPTTPAELTIKRAVIDNTGKLAVTYAILLDPSKQNQKNLRTVFAVTLPSGQKSEVKADLPTDKLESTLTTTFTTSIKPTGAPVPISAQIIDTTGAALSPVSQGTAQELTIATATEPASPDQVRAETEFGSITSLGQYMKKIMGYALPLGIALSVLMTIYAGIILMISQGSPDRVKDAQEIIQGAILGLMVLILSRLLVDFLLLPTDTITYLLIDTRRG